MPNIPLGPTAEVITSGREFLWSRVEGTYMIKTVIIDASSRDQNNTHRKGLCLGKITSSGKYKTYASGSGDGSGIFAGILNEEADLMDQNGNMADRIATIVVFGRVKVSNVFGLDGTARGQANGNTSPCLFIFD